MCEQPTPNNERQWMNGYFHCHSIFDKTPFERNEQTENGVGNFFRHILYLAVSESWDLIACSSVAVIVFDVKLTVSTCLGLKFE